MVRTDLLLRAKTWSSLVLERGRFTNSLNTSRVHQIGVLSSGVFLGACVLWIISNMFVYLALTSLAINLGSNYPLFRSFARERGLAFALRVAPLHLIHQWCAGTGFVLAALEHAYKSTSLGQAFRVLRRKRQKGDYPEYQFERKAVLADESSAVMRPGVKIPRNKSKG